MGLLVPPRLAVLSLLLGFQAVAGEESEGSELGVDKHPAGAGAPGSVQGKVRLSVHSTVEISNCLLSAGDVGCAVFECLENHTCEIHNLYEVCRIFLQNAGKFDAQGKLFIKDFLKCNANGIKSRFSCNIRRCSVIQEILSELQKECYQNFDICAIAHDNVNAIAEMIDLHDLLLNGAYLEFVKILFDCDAHIVDVIKKSIRSRYESNLSILRRMVQDDTCTSAQKAKPEDGSPTAGSAERPRKVSKKGRSADLDNATSSRDDYWNQKREKARQRVQ